jgi:multidrug efflux system outer membrane protein
VNRSASLALLAAFTLAACAVGPDYERPATLPTAPTFRDHPEDASTIADSAWFDVFGDPVLRGLVDRALANNRDLHVAVSRVEEQRYLAAVARSPLLPQVGYGLGAGRSEHALFGAPDPNRGAESLFLAAANLSWEIDLWGRIRRSAEAARGELLATDAARRGVVLSLVAGIATAYFELRELDLELEIAKNATVSFQETLDLFGRRYRGGVASKLDSLRAEAALAQVAALVPDTERRIVAKENEIAVLVGETPQPTERGLALVDQPLAPDVPAGVPAQLLERRPDLMQAEETLVANNAAIGANFANYFPRIGLTAVGGAVSHELSDLLKSGSSLWALGADAAGPLFTAGRTTYQWRASQKATEAAVASYEGTMLNALREVSNALTTREKLVTVRANRERAVAALEESLKTARVRYTGGLATYLEVLDAQQQLYPEQLRLAQARRDQLLAVVELYRALGGSWNQSAQPPEIPLPIAP